MAAHSSSLAWRVPWTEEPGGLQSVGSQRWARLSTRARSTFLQCSLCCGVWNRGACADRVDPPLSSSWCVSLPSPRSDHDLSLQCFVLFLICYCCVTEHFQVSGLNSTCSFLGDHALVPGWLTSLRPTFLPRSWPSGPSLCYYSEASRRHSFLLPAFEIVLGEMVHVNCLP